jgi:hypothetical protein
MGNQVGSYNEGAYLQSPATPQSGGGYSTGGSALTAAGGGMAMIPGLQLAGAATSLAGVGLSAYGNYQAGKTAEKNYELQMMAYLEDKKRKKELDTYNRQQNERANTLAYGNYAGGIKKDAADTYGQYNTSIGA